MLRRMGAVVTASLERPGFYPVGGGKFIATVTPGRLDRIEVVQRGAELSRGAEAIVSNLPLDIGRRELDEVAHRLSIDQDSLRLSGRTRAMGPGNIIMVTLDFEQVTEVFSGHGKVGVRAEHVADKVVMNAQRWLASGAAVGPHLADQLLLPMALAGGGRYTIGRPSLHTRTNAEVIRQFVDVDIAITPVAEKRWEVTVRS